MSIRHLAVAACLALPLAACATTSYYPPAGGGYMPGYGGPNYNAQPNYGTISLSAGFVPDPVTVNLSSGGTYDASMISSSCRGYIAGPPDVRLHYQAGSLPLILSVSSSTDTTLVVNGPNGQWYCDDDGGAYGLNPALRFDYPQSGQYDIWVGTYGSATYAPATLHISELYSQ